MELQEQACTEPQNESPREVSPEMVDELLANQDIEVDQMVENRFVDKRHVEDMSELEELWNKAVDKNETYKAACEAV